MVYTFYNFHPGEKNLPKDIRFVFFFWRGGGGYITQPYFQGITMFEKLTSFKNFGVVLNFLFSSESRTSRLAVILKQAEREPCDKYSLKYTGGLKG